MKLLISAKLKSSKNKPKWTKTALREIVHIKKLITFKRPFPTTSHIFMQSDS